MESDWARAERAGSPTWRQFFAEAQFAEIRDYIDRPRSDYRVVSLGLHPSIALYNGFYTLDAYLSSYPLAYKHEFRRIISAELAKDDTLRRYYDDWGSRCYLFSAELGPSYMWTRRWNKAITRYDGDWHAFREMGGRFILSAVAIKDAQGSGLELMRIFEHDDSAWRVHLYRVGDGVSGRSLAPGT